MNNFGRAVLAVGLSTVMTFTNPVSFFQTEGMPASVEAAEVRTAAEGRTGADSGESESTTEVTTEKKQETTTVTDSKSDTDSSTEKSTQQSQNTGHTNESSTGSTSNNPSGTGSSTSSGGTQTGSLDRESSTDEAGTQHGGTEKTQQESTTSSKTNNKIASRKDAEIHSEQVKDIKNELADEAAPEGSDKTSTFIPKIYNDTRLAMKNNKEYIAGYVYFNQTDSAWNQNGYCIAKAGCGPTSMAVVITSLTGKWVTPLDTAIWGYQHGFYSRAGSAHEMIPAMAAAYGLRCQGVGASYAAIKKALKAGKPVVCLMGPGYFTRGGHFMVLVAIDENDCVTVADVGSRARSAYKYRLADVIAQSKGASAGGPFWVMSYDKDSRAALREKKAIKNYTQEDMEADFADISYMNVKADLPETLKKEKKEVSVKKVVSILKMSTGKSLLSSLTSAGSSVETAKDTTGIFSPVDQNTQVVVTGRDKKGNSESVKEKLSTDLAHTLKKDIARRQWEKRIPLTQLEGYAKGTIER